MSFMGELKVEENLTQDEKREILGYAPIQVNEPINPTE